MLCCVLRCWAAGCEHLHLSMFGRGCHPAPGRRKCPLACLLPATSRWSCCSCGNPILSWWQVPREYSGLWMVRLAGLLPAMLRLAAHIRVAQLAAGAPRRDLAAGNLAWWQLCMWMLVWSVCCITCCCWSAHSRRLAMHSHAWLSRASLEYGLPLHPTGRVMWLPACLWEPWSSLRACRMPSWRASHKVRPSPSWGLLGRLHVTHVAASTWTPSCPHLTRLPCCARWLNRIRSVRRICALHRLRPAWLLTATGCW